MSNLSAGDTKALAECLTKHPNLQTLNLKRNRIGADGAKALAEGLTHCPSLQTLNLELVLIVPRLLLRV